MKNSPPKKLILAGFAFVLASIFAQGQALNNPPQPIAEVKGIPIDDKLNPPGYTVELQEKVPLNLMAYPNPSTGVFYIEKANLQPGQSLEIYNLIGVLVKKITTRCAKRQQIDASNLPAGYYLLKLEEDVIKIRIS